MGDRLPAPSHHNTDPLTTKLKKAIVLGRWLFVVGLWLTLGIYSLWGLRGEFGLWREHLTWTSVRYGLAYHPFPTLSLVICVAYTCAVLVWHSQKLLQGWSERETYRLDKEAKKIAQNPRHWLWLVLKKI
ncbi:MAG: hypothetical protein HC799_07390 [Limnothrix sp. RL_2_0]|nr:hypothetical protein [Limnothrix sp. RL_2_0]